MPNAIQHTLDKAVAAGAASGFVAAARKPSGEVLVAAAGVRGLDNPAPMTPDTVFWIASCTKAITTVAVLQLVEAGKLGLDDAVGGWLPQLTRPKVLAGFDAAGAPQLRDAARPITVRHLVTHTSGLAYEMFNPTLARYAEIAGPTPLGATPDYPLMFEPGEAWCYSIGLDWAGQLVEAVSGKSFEAYLAEHVLGPLGMTDTGFALGEAQRGRLASMHGRGADGALSVRPFAMPPPPYFSMGGGGLYSTARDYLAFLEAILGGGGPILGPAMAAATRAVEIEGPDVGVLPSANAALTNPYDPFPGQTKQWGLGFLINPAPGPNGRSAGSLAWGGLGNCYYWADPATGAAGVLLAQLLPFGDPAVLEAFGDFERAVYSA